MKHTRGSTAANVLISISVNGMNYRQVNSQEIVRLAGENNYTWIYLADGSKYLMSQTLKYYYQLIPGFLRVHKAHIVNPQFVDQIQVVPVATDPSKRQWSKPRQIRLKSGDTLPWSRRCYRHYTCLS